jgi:hypothetical protein
MAAVRECRIVTSRICGGSAHRDLIPRLGQVVLNNFSTAPHPLTTEVFEIHSIAMAIDAYAPEPERT